MNARLKILIGRTSGSRSKSARALSESPDIVCRQIQFPDADLRGLGGQRDALFELAQVALFLEQIGDIHAGADVAPEIPVRSGARDALIGDPTVFPVVPPHAVLGQKGSRASNALRYASVAFSPILGVNNLPPAAAQVPAREFAR